MKRLSPSDVEAPLSLIGKRIVVVEDEGITLMQLRRTLLKEGLLVVGVANNGQAAVEIVLRERPDLVLMDIRMPMMDGLEAARRILADYSVCIVMLTAFAAEEYVQQAQEVGAAGYIHKPIISETLVSHLQQAWTRFHTG